MLLLIPLELTLHYKPYIYKNKHNKKIAFFSLKFIKLHQKVCNNEIMNGLVIDKKDYILESERLRFRALDYDDFESLKEILGDIETMYAWEHTFDDKGIKDWIDGCKKRYEHDKCAYFAAEDKQSGEFIGIMGPLIEYTDCESAMGIAYILKKEHWGKGYAFEGAKASVEYAFEQLDATRVIAQIRPDNISSLKVAQKLGMKFEYEYLRDYRGKKIAHKVFGITQKEFEDKKTK